MRVLHLFFIGGLFLFAGCKAKQLIPVAPSSAETVINNEASDVTSGPVMEVRDLDTMFVSASKLEKDTTVMDSLPVYHATYDRPNDLLHTKLELRFNWQEEKVIGKATLDIKPYFYPVHSVQLDAKGFEFNHISLSENGTITPLTYQYNGSIVEIDLGKTYSKNQTYRLIVDYVATPTEQGGSEAITSDKGLFFINPRKEDPDKPMQIWTQGEMEWNSKWFPTIDKPNERCTQEMYITVEDQFKTLSNGILQSSQKNADGTRTDYWKMDLPHAPYLFMLAIGDYAVVKETWNGIPLEYYVEPDYASSAKEIFSHTPEMLDFFSKILGIKYPWPKLAQVVVRDYVSGAMENTTGIIYGEFVQKHNKDLVDNHNEEIVAHEIFHHWFGNLVTCESWSNLVLNEGFANYSEYLWNEYKYGRDAADFQLLNQWSGYISSARGGMHPLIHFAYGDREDMFDQHSYNKGGAVLHMLRNLVGDEAFYGALKNYLQQNSFKSVEVHDLRLAFEQITGQDLNWFFNQWYLQAGHPVLNIEYGWDEPNKIATVTVEQQQDQNESPAIFILPTYVDIYLGKAKPIRKEIVVDRRKQTFSFPLPEKPALMNFDPEKILLCERQENKSEAEYVFQFLNAPRFFDRYQSLYQIAYSEDLPGKNDLLKAALQDSFWLIRGFALSTLAQNPETIGIEAIKKIASTDPKSQLRSSAFDVLTELADSSAIDLALLKIEKEKAQAVINAAFRYLSTVSPTKAILMAPTLEKEGNSEMVQIISELYGHHPGPEALLFFERQLEAQKGFEAVNFFESYQKSAVVVGGKSLENAISKWTTIGLDQEKSPWLRFGATKSLHECLKALQEKQGTEGAADEKSQMQIQVSFIKESIAKIKSTETNEQLKTLYNQF